MARHGMLNHAIFRLVIIGLLAMLATVPVLAQDEAGEETEADKFAKIQATSDSLGFGSTSADSLREIPVIIEDLDDEAALEIAIIENLQPHAMPTGAPFRNFFIRVATYVHQIPTAVDMIKDAHDKGYETTVNLMAVSTVREHELDQVLEALADERLAALTLARQEELRSAAVTSGALSH